MSLIEGLVALIGGLWIVTSGLAVALYARVRGDHVALSERVGYLEQNAAMRIDIAEIKELIRENTRQTEDMRKEAKQSVIGVHSRVDSISGQTHKLETRVAVMENSK